MKQPASPVANPPVWMKESPFDWLPDLPVRDYILCLASDFDVDAQLEAIHGLLQRNREAEQAHTEEIRQAAEQARRLQGIWNERAVDEHIELLHASVYQDAAHSMAAVGMLAPLIETIFFQSFRGIGRKFFPVSMPACGHERWNETHAMQWDCHYVIAKGRTQKDLVRGIMQLAEAVGLKSRLPSDIEPMLSALFGYRNKMFHCGFEWPIEERIAFQNRINESGWPSAWFAKATSGKQPWVFYLTDSFIQHCLKDTVEVLTGIGEFVRDELLPRSDRQGGRV